MSSGYAILNVQNGFTIWVASARRILIIIKEKHGNRIYVCINDLKNKDNYKSNNFEGTINILINGDKRTCHYILFLSIFQSIYIYLSV